MKYSIVVNGELQKVPNGTKVRETEMMYNTSYFEHYLKLLISTVYKDYQNLPSFEEYVNDTFQESLQYFMNCEQPNIDELAGYFIDEVDVDFDQKLSEEMAYRLTEWIFEGYYRFIAGDYTLLD